MYSYMLSERLINILAAERHQDILSKDILILLLRAMRDPDLLMADVADEARCACGWRTDWEILVDALTAQLEGIK